MSNARYVKYLQLSTTRRGQKKYTPLVTCLSLQFTNEFQCDSIRPFHPELGVVPLGSRGARSAGRAETDDEGTGRPRFLSEEGQWVKIETNSPLL